MKGLPYGRKKCIRVSKESIFSELNNLTVVTVTLELYADGFGFTEKEVRMALKEYGMEDKMHAASLEAKGILKERIQCYGLAFEGKRVLIE